jgi:thymidylate synthase (FAD)
MHGERKVLKIELLSHTPVDKVREVLKEGGTSDSELLPHISFTFAVEDISRACSHQLVRHRMASFSQQSQRYTPIRRLKERVIVPPSIEEKTRILFNEHIDSASKTYETMVREGVPREDARFVLPNATETHLLITMDGSSLFHFFGLRCCTRAQWEIKTLADRMLVELRREAPKIFERAGPYCFQWGHCPEGMFTCGKMKEVAEKYGYKIQNSV